MNPLTNIKNINKLNEIEADLGLSSNVSWHQQYNDSAYIFTGGLPYKVNEGDILAIFSQYGEIVNINLVRDKKTGKSQGYCFIAYEDQRSTILAVDNLNGIQLLGRTIKVDHVSSYRKPKENDEDDEVTKLLRKEGCAPKIEESPVPSTTEDESFVLPLKKAKKEKKSKRQKSESKKTKKKHKEGKSSTISSEAESGAEKNNVRPDTKSRTAIHISSDHSIGVSNDEATTSRHHSSGRREKESSSSAISSRDCERYEQQKERSKDVKRTKEYYTGRSRNEDGRKRRSPERDGREETRSQKTRMDSEHDRYGKRREKTSERDSIKDGRQNYRNSASSRDDGRYDRR